MNREPLLRSQQQTMNDEAAATISSATVTSNDSPATRDVSEVKRALGIGGLTINYGRDVLLLWDLHVSLAWLFHTQHETVSYTAFLDIVHREFPVMTFIQEFYNVM